MEVLQEDGDTRQHRRCAAGMRFLLRVCAQGWAAANYGVDKREWAEACVDGSEGDCEDAAI